MSIDRIHGFNYLFSQTNCKLLTDTNILILIKIIDLTLFIKVEQQNFRIAMFFSSHRRVFIWEIVSELTGISLLNKLTIFVKLCNKSLIPASAMEGARSVTVNL